jgi:hypothetical protein
MMADVTAEVRPDGALVLTGTSRDGQMRLELGARGSLSLLTLHGEEWSTTHVQTGPAASGRGHLLRVRSACSAADGGIDARFTLRSSTGQRFERDLRIDTDGSRRWTGSQLLTNGVVLSNEGSFADSVARSTQRAVEQDGKNLWTEEKETRFETDARSPQAVTASTTATRSYDKGGTRTTHSSFAADVALRSESVSLTALESGETTVQEWVTQNEDGSITTTKVTLYPDGSQSTETVTTSQSSSAGVTQTTTETTITAQSSEGGPKVEYHELSESSSDEASGASTSTWEKSYTDDKGQAINQHGSQASDGQGNASETISQIDPDGTITIETTTIGEGGVTVTTTIVTPSGESTTTTTTSADGEGTVNGTNGSAEGGGARGSGGPDGPTGRGEGGGRGAGGGGWGETCPDGGDRIDCIPKVLGSEEGEHISASRILPDDVGRILDELASSRLDPGAAPLASQIATGVRRRSPFSQLGGERGEAAIELGGLRLARELAEVHDPAAQVACATELIAALARSGALRREAIGRSLVLCGVLERTVARHLS